MLETEEYVTADDGVRLFVQRVGDGPDAVIIPNRVYLADAFARLADRRTLIFAIRRNRGRSDRVTDLVESRTRRPSRRRRLRCDPSPLWFRPRQPARSLVHGRWSSRCTR